MSIQPLNKKSFLGAIILSIKFIFNKINELVKWANTYSSPNTTYGSLNGADYGIIADGVTDNTASFNTFMAACKAGILKGALPKGTIRLVSKPNDIDFNWTLEGKGILSTILLRDYVESTSTTGCLNLIPNCNGTTFTNFSIQASAASTGGALISAISTTGYSIGVLVFKNLILSTLGTNTHVYSLFLDGALKTTAPTGLRDTALENVHIYGSSNYSIYLKSVIGFHWKGGGAYTTGGTGDYSGVVVITGTADVNSEFINLDITRNAQFILTDCKQLILRSASIGSINSYSVDNNGTCTYTQVQGRPTGLIRGNWGVSGIRRPSAAFATT